MHYPLRGSSAAPATAPATTFGTRHGRTACSRTLRARCRPSPHCAPLTLLARVAHRGSTGAGEHVSSPFVVEQASGANAAAAASRAASPFYFMKVDLAGRAPTSRARWGERREARARRGVGCAGQVEHAGTERWAACALGGRCSLFVVVSRDTAGPLAAALSCLTLQNDCCTCVLLAAMPAPLQRRAAYGRLRLRRRRQRCGGGEARALGTALGGPAKPRMGCHVLRLHAASWFPTLPPLSRALVAMVLGLGNWPWS